MIKRGYTRISYAHAGRTPDILLIAPEHYSWRDRYLGYSQAMKEAGLEPQFFDPKAKLWGLPFNQLARALSKTELPEVLFCYHSFVAHQYLIATAIMGIQVPGVLTILSVGGQNLIHAGFPIATAICQRFNCGVDAIENLISRLEDKEKLCKPIALPFEFDFSRIDS